MGQAARIGVGRADDILRSRHGWRVVVLAVLAVLIPPLVGWAPAASAQALLMVDSSLDEPDAVPNDGLCLSTPSGKCTLRAAIGEVDNAGTVTLPAGLYVLTIPAGAEAGGPADLALGDLDITKEVTITGAGADRTIVDGNNDHRIFDIHTNGFAHISGVSLRGGRAEFSAPTGHRHGGILHNHGKLDLRESTVSGGVADAGAPWGGAGITNAGNGTATLRNVTIARNTTTYYGGGIENGGPLTLANVTLAENTAPAGQGGGIASGVGFFATAAGQATLQNSIVSANNGGNCRGPTVTSAGYNLENTATCPFINPGDQFNTDPLLSAVNNTAGSISVYALLSGSPAIDRASPLACPPTDELGVTRPQEGDGVPPAFCDIGASERPPAKPTCDGQTATIVGTEGDDRIRGTSGVDVIVGLGGNDRIAGRGGNDIVCGGTGRDDLRGDNGADRLFGEQDDDTLRGNSGNDLLDGGPNIDRCLGGSGTNVKVGCES